jgi:heat shock protein HtpX
MLVAMVATPLLVVALLAVVAVYAPVRVIVFVAIAGVVGTALAVNERKSWPRGRALAPGEAPELHAILERLCVMADLPKPALVIHAERQPNSWIVGTGGDRYHLHLTQGLLDCLEPNELEAVIAHELAHVAHRDAAVMTVVGGPGSVLLSGGARLARSGWPAMMGGGVAMTVGWVGSIGTRALSRYREFAADAGSVALTGNPAALASALTKVSEGIGAIPVRDMRVAAARDAFNLLPTGRHGKADFHLPPTHPPLAARIARLERLEHRLQAARRF